jgi:hypothetical protein
MSAVQALATPPGADIAFSNDPLFATGQATAADRPAPPAGQGQASRYSTLDPWHATAAAGVKQPAPGPDTVLMSEPEAVPPVRRQGRGRLAARVGLLAAALAAMTLVAFLVFREPAGGRGGRPGAPEATTPVGPVAQKDDGKVEEKPPAKPNPVKPDKPDRKDKDMALAKDGDKPPNKPEKPPAPPQVGVLYSIDSRTPIRQAAFAADGGRVLVSNEDTVWVYDLTDLRGGKPILPGYRYPFRLASWPQRPPLAAGLSADGSRAVLATSDQVVESGQLRREPQPLLAALEVESQDAPRVLSGIPSPITCVAVCPTDQGRVLTGTKDGFLCLWDLERHDPRALSPWVGHKEVVECVAFAPDGRKAASGGRDRKVCLWSVADRKPLFTFGGHQGHVAAAAFSADGQQLLSGSFDKTARLWSVKGLLPVAQVVLEGHEEAVRCVALSPDGRRALTGSDDKTALLWDLKTGQSLKSFHHQDTVVAVAFSPDGRYAVTVGRDNTIRRWELPQ